MEFAMINDSTDVLMAEGYAALVNVDLGANRAVPFADELKAKMRALEGRSLDG
jgi:acyl-CoA thioesterase FadM